MDRIGQALQRLGYVVSRKHLIPDGVDGYCFNVKSGEIVYSIDSDDETVIIPLFRRLGPRTGLQNAFAPLIWFVRYLAAESTTLCVKRVKGLIWAQPDEWAGAMPSDRIAEFYQRLLGAKSVGTSRLGEWLCLELSDFKSLRRFREESRFRRSPGHVCL